jgi:hypothetical protein
MHIRLNNPDNLFAWVIEIKLDFIGGRTNGFITSELKLLNEVFVWVLCHASALISVKEDIVDVEGSSYERFSVSVGDFLGATSFGGFNATDCEKALIKRTDLDIDFNLVVLEGNKRKSKSRVATEPELKRNVKSSFRESSARGTDSLGDISSTASGGNISESRVCKVSKLGSLANHFVVTRFLFTCKSKLVPDVHPVTILTINSLTTNLNLNHRDHLFPRAI